MKRLALTVAALALAAVTAYGDDIRVAGQKYTTRDVVPLGYYLADSTLVPVGGASIYGLPVTDATASSYRAGLTPIIATDSTAVAAMDSSAVIDCTGYNNLALQVDWANCPNGGKVYLAIQVRGHLGGIDDSTHRAAFVGIAGDSTVAAGAVATAATAGTQEFISILGKTTLGIASKRYPLTVAGAPIFGPYLSVKYRVMVITGMAFQPRIRVYLTGSAQR